MSASLVGSEMCIRDSCCSTRAGRMADARSERRPSPAAAGGAQQRGGAPVSYTHLTLPTICSV
eukprot:4758561-Alexandrium_andersonii.AAC.1